MTEQEAQRMLAEHRTVNPVSSSPRRESMRTAATTVKHTPGPWHVYRDYAGFLRIHGGPYVIATVIDGIDEAPDQPEYHANARLLAAAPELLAALRELTRAFDETQLPVSERLDAALSAADAAIARAEGR